LRIRFRSKAKAGAEVADVADSVDSAEVVEAAGVAAVAEATSILVFSFVQATAY